mmetsp:Transcript_5095/g.8685  ORF Transcript_5095/g.8685 Transcript_5095/m.8685 type:complete len:342 (-) Transcript_5095:1343-2368(-)
MHSERLSQLNASLLKDVHQLPHGLLLGVIRLTGVARSWSDSTVFDLDALLRSELLVRGIAPVVSSHLLVEDLCQGLSKAISESLRHHVVEVVARVDVLLAHLLLPESGRAGEKAQIVSLLRGFGSNEVAHGQEAVLVLVHLLPEGEELGLDGPVSFINDLNVIFGVGVAGVEANDAPCVNELVVDHVSEHGLGLVEELLGLLAHGLVVEDLGVGLVGVLASDLPGVEEGIPVDVLDQLLEVVVLEDPSPGKGGLYNFDSLPVGLQSLRAGLGERDKGFVLLAVVVLLAQLFVLFLDLLLVLDLVVGVKQLLHYNHGARGIEHVHSLVALVVGLDFDGSVHF